MSEGVALSRCEIKLLHQVDLDCTYDRRIAVTASVPPKAVAVFAISRAYAGDVFGSVFASCRSWSMAGPAVVPHS